MYNIMENHPWKSPASIEAEKKWKELREDFKEVNKSKQIYEKEKVFFEKFFQIIRSGSGIKEEHKKELILRIMSDVQERLETFRSKQRKYEKKVFHLLGSLDIELLRYWCLFLQTV